MPTLYRKLKNLPWAAVPPVSSVSTDHGRRARRTIKVALAPANSIQAGASAALMVRRDLRPWSVLTDETAGMAAQGSFLSCRYSVGMFAFTKRATDYDVSVASCRARWWSRR